MARNRFRAGIGNFRSSDGIIAGALAIAALGFVILTQIGGSWPLAVLVTGMMVFCLGLSPVGTLTTDLVLGSAPPERAGAASAISETSFELGGAIGIAVLGSVVTAAYRERVIPALPAELPAELALAASGTLAAALEVAGELPGNAGATLAAASKAAFTHAMELSSILCAAIAVGTALLAWATLHRRRSPPAAGEALTSGG